MKILFVNTDLCNGGAEKIMAWLSGKLADKGNKVFFATYRDTLIDFNTLSNNVIRIHLNTESKNKKLLSSIKTIISLHHLIKREKFDLTIAFLMPSQLRLLIASRFTQTKVLFSHRGDPYQNLQASSFTHKAILKLNDIAFKLADRYVFQTIYAQEFYNKRIRKKSAVIANPVRPILRTKERAVEKRIVTVSRLDVKQKRQDLLIKAFKKLFLEYSDYTLEFYGNGPDKVFLQNLAMDNGNIKFCGETDNVADAIQNAAMFVLTSDFEGIPNALLEAMSIGVPCISTDCSPGGAAMLIQNNENGLIIERNNIEKLYDAMKFYIENKDTAEDYARQAKRVNDLFSEEAIFLQWEEVINDMASRSGG